MMKGLITIAALFIFEIAHAQTVTDQPKPFSAYRAYSGLVFVSGQIGSPEAGFSKEVHQAIRNVSEILRQAGTSLDSVLSVTVYLRNLQQFDEFNSIYREYFHAPFPARTCIAVSDLVQKANVEISVVARR
jgi:2-iminobutanoate/2-iminopropanoate deaminase